MSTCIFCRIIAGEIPARIVHRTEGFVAFHDAAPKAPVHILVVPVRHVASIAAAAELEEAERAEMPLFIADVARMAGVDGSGYRVATNHGADARQAVHHLHWHVMGGVMLSDSM